MVCTNNKNIYEIIRTIRGHGLLRESKDQFYKKNTIKKHKNLNKEFLFVNPGFNLRSTEINAIYGLSQIKRLIAITIKEQKIFYFLKRLNKEKYYTDFDVTGSYNYAFIILFNESIKIWFLEKN